MNQAIEWNEKYETNIETIDQQHKNLFRIINNLFDAVRNHKNRSELTPIARELLEYTEYHFSYEEKHFHLFSFSKTAEHEVDHRLFTQKVKEFSDEIAQDKLSSAMPMLDFLINWLVDHIILKDKRYVPLFLQKKQEIEAK